MFVQNMTEDLGKTKQEIVNSSSSSEPDHRFLVQPIMGLNILYNLST